MFQILFLQLMNNFDRHLGESLKIKGQKAQKEDKMQKRKYTEPILFTVSVNGLDVLLASGGAYIGDPYNDGWGETL